MKRHFSILSLLFAFFMLFNSCKKTAGQGGNAQITGKIWVQDWDDPYFTYILHEYPGANVTVNLYFEDDLSPGATEKTNDQGEFQFKFLRKGNYKVSVYSKIKQDPLNVNSPKVEAIESKLTLNKRKEISDIGTLTIKQ
jgi:hypothetical protein